jgi:hypothetical protein
MKRIALVLFIAIIAQSASAMTTITDSTATGFTVRHELSVNVTSDSLWKCFLRVGNWWDPEHTWSMDAKNLYLDPKAGGVFGETLSNGGSALHMVVYYINPGVTIILRGAIGPLMSQGIEGAMSFTFTPDGDSTRIQFQYMAGGYTPGGMWRFAPMVDSVLKHQLERLKGYAEGKL